MDICKLTKEDFEKVPVYDGHNYNYELFESIVIIPTEDIHVSQWRCMDYCLINENDEPMVRISSGSDVLHLDGIGGYGDWNPCNGVPIVVEPKGFQIDCLPCGYLRVFPRYGMHFKKGQFFGSSVEVYAD